MTPLLRLAAVWVTLALIATSAICGAATDLSFNLGGYMWQIVNCALTAGYSLSLRGAMDKVSPGSGLHGDGRAYRCHTPLATTSDLRGLHGGSISVWPAWLTETGLG